jgi:hypothetical protein
MKLVHWVQGVVAKVLLWPLDLVDHISGYADPYSFRCKAVMCSFMLFFYSVASYSIVDILRLTIFNW